MFCALLLACVLTPPQQQPYLLGAPVTMTVDENTATENGLQTQSVYWKEPGLQEVHPKFHPAPSSNTVPFFHKRGESDFVPWEKEGIELDAFSTDVNYLPATSGGVIDQTIIDFEFAGLIFSVTEDTAGAMGSVYQQEANNGADLYEFMFPGSSIGIVDTVVNVIDEQSVALGPPVPQVVALDMYVPLLQINNIATELLGEFERVVFSVTGASKDEVPETWWKHEDGSSFSGPRNGATLFAVDWDDDVPNDWDLYPYVLLSSADLGLNSTDDVTAVAWHHQNNENYLLFSSEESANQVRFVRLSSSAPYSVQFIGDLMIGSVTAHEKLGLVGASDKVDAISAFDPRRDLIKLIGKPLGTHNGLFASTFRSRNYDAPGGPADELVTCMKKADSGGAQSSWAAVLGRWQGGQPMLHGIVPMPAAGAGTEFHIGDIPLMLVGLRYEIQWVATDDLYGQPPEALSAWIGIDL